VEVDGGWHAGRERADGRRDRALERAGWRVVRVEAALVMAELHAAVERVREALVAGKKP
jgi:very-short-patch-repair endonuclease